MPRLHPLLTASLLALSLQVFAPAVAAAQAPASPIVPAATATPTPNAPVIDLKVNGGSGGAYVTAIKVFLMLTLLSLAPAILLSVTSFTRIIIVLSLLRHAVGVQNLPPGRVLVGVALFLSIFTMAPTFREINVKALTPYEHGEIDGRAALQQAVKPLRLFMFTHTRAEDLDMFLELSGAQEAEDYDDVSTFTLIPSFMLSELKTAFQMGAMLFLPFLVIDLIVASVLMSMGMMMLPPVMVSLPIKLFVFVLADGWTLIIGSLAESFLLPAASVT